MNLLQRFQCVKVLYNKSCNEKLFNTKSCLLSKAIFNERSAKFKKLKNLQAEFQKDDGLPVFLKRGFRDKLLYNITLISTIGGVIYSFKILFDLDKPYWTNVD